MAIIDKAEQKVLIITGCLMSLFVFSILYAKGKYKSDVPVCLPFDKAYIIFQEPINIILLPYDLL